MEQYLWIVWLAIFVIAVAVEASGPSLVSIWFAIAALVTMIISFIPGVAWWIELIVFIVAHHSHSDGNLPPRAPEPSR